MICAKFCWFWRRKFFKNLSMYFPYFANLSMYFRYFAIISPWKRAGPFKVESFSSKGELAKWFWRRFLKFVNVFLVFLNYLPLKKDGALHLNKLESPSPKDDLCQVCLKLAQWFWRRRFSKCVNVFLLFRIYLPLEKGRALF